MERYKKLFKEEQIIQNFYTDKDGKQYIPQFKKGDEIWFIPSPKSIEKYRIPFEILIGEIQDTFFNSDKKEIYHTIREFNQNLLCFNIPERNISNEFETINKVFKTILWEDKK